MNSSKQRICYVGIEKSSYIETDIFSIKNLNQIINIIKE